MIATAEQPLTIAANARLDGREELIAKLKGKLSLKQSPTDAELILSAYEAWGEDCVKHLIGDFAFAIYDHRLQRIFCARDHFGVKPFFYARPSERFVFSSVLKSLGRSAGQSWQTDRRAAKKDPLNPTSEFTRLSRDRRNIS